MFHSSAAQSAGSRKTLPKTSFSSLRHFFTRKSRSRTRFSATQSAGSRKSRSRYRSSTAQLAYICKNRLETYSSTLKPVGDRTTTDISGIPLNIQLHLVLMWKLKKKKKKIPVGFIWNIHQKIVLKLLINFFHFIISNNLHTFINQILMYSFKSMQKMLYSPRMFNIYHSSSGNSHTLCVDTQPHTHTHTKYWGRHTLRIGSWHLMMRHITHWCQTI